MKYKDQAQHEAFEDYEEEVITFVKDYNYAEALFSCISDIYTGKDKEKERERLWKLIDTDREGIIISLVHSVRHTTLVRLEERLRHPVMDSEMED